MFIQDHSENQRKWDAFAGHPQTFLGLPRFMFKNCETYVTVIWFKVIFGLKMHLTKKIFFERFISNFLISKKDIKPLWRLQIL